MQLFKSFLCIDFPPIIRIELKERYFSWFENCVFGSIEFIRKKHFDLIILPAKKLIDLEIDSVPKIAFGPQELLETSFLYGVVDYLKDPWLCSELVIRSKPFFDGYTLRNNSMVIRYQRGILQINENRIDLSPSQSKLMMVLMKNSNAYVGYSLLKDVLRIKSENAVKTIHVHMHLLRTILKAELPQNYGKSLYIKNSSSLGYSLIFICG